MPSDIAEIRISSGNATIHDEIIVIENASSGANFVVFGPTGSTWTKNGNTFSSSLDNKTYWSVAMLPLGSYNILDKANDYKTFAYTFPCLLYTSPSPRDLSTSRMPSSA